MNKIRGAVNVEYIILIVVGALAVVLGLGYLSTTMNDKHSQVGGAISEKVVAFGGNGGTVPPPAAPEDIIVAGAVHKTDGTYEIFWNDTVGPYSVKNGSGVEIYSGTDTEVVITPTPPETFTITDNNSDFGTINVTELSESVYGYGPSAAAWSDVIVGGGMTAEYNKCAGCHQLFPSMAIGYYRCVPDPAGGTDMVYPATRPIEVMFQNAANAGTWNAVLGTYTNPWGSYTFQSQMVPYLLTNGQTYNVTMQVYVPASTGALTITPRLLYLPQTASAYISTGNEWMAEAAMDTIAVGTSNANFTDQAGKYDEVLGVAVTQYDQWVTVNIPYTYTGVTRLYSEIAVYADKYPFYFKNLQIN